MTTLAFLIFGVAWLTPLAYLTIIHPVWQWACLVAAQLGIMATGLEVACVG